MDYKVSYVVCHIIYEYWLFTANLGKRWCSCSVEIGNMMNHSDIPCAWPCSNAETANLVQVLVWCCIEHLAI